MSVGPSALGTVLVQRLDAVLGTTMAAHANLVSGARPDAVAQPGEVARPGQTDGTGRQPRPPVDPAGARGPAVADAKTADTLPQAAQRLVTRSDTTASAPTTLGQTARTILALLALYPDQAPPAQGKAPLWPSPAPRGANPAAASGPPTSGPAASRSSASGPIASGPIAPGTAAGLASPLPTAAALAGALRQALQTSGLFYESHLGDLAFGQRTAEQLRGEPQAALARAPADTGQPDSRAAPATGAPPHREASASSGGHTPAPAAAAPGAPAPAPAGIHADAAPLVRQQLDILANQALVWQGEAWPDAPMEWEVRRDAPEGRADAPAHWATRLTLDLPRLGLVEARLSLAGDQLVMQLTAPRGAREINGAAQALRAGLQRAGLALSHLSVGATAARPAETAP